MWCTSRLPTKFGRTNYDELLSFQIIFNAFHTIYRFGDTFSTVTLCLRIDGTGELNHAVGGFNFHMTGRDDIGTTPGARLPYGDEPDPITHLQTVAPHHAYYYSGISDILTLDETIKRNPQALVQLCLGAFKAGMREFTANVSGNDLVRVTGYMVRLSDLEKYRAEGSRTNTTWLGEEAARNTRILERQPRVISHEQQMRFSQ